MRSQTLGNLSGQVPGGGAPSISGWNFLNLFSFGLLATVAICVYTGVIGDARVALYQTHVTLLTPAPFVDIAWPIVFIGDAVFVVMQFLPWYRASELVTVVTPFWCISCFLQVWWIIELGRDNPGSQGFAVALVSASAMLLLAMILSMDLYRPGFFEYWIIRAPFSLHAGWLVCTAVTQINLFADASEFSGEARLMIAVISFTFLALLASLFSVTTRRPDPVFPIPIMWNCLWIFQLTPEQKAKIKAPMNDPALINGFGFAACQVLFAMIWLIIAAFILRGVVCCRSNKREEKIKALEVERRSKTLGSFIV